VLIHKSDIITPLDVLNTFCALFYAGLLIMNRVSAANASALTRGHKIRLGLLLLMASINLIMLIGCLLKRYSQLHYMRINS
jgi:hypothetical protein